MQILTDGTSTYTLFRYPRIMWTLPGAYGNFANVQIPLPVAGWSNGDSVSPIYQNIMRSGTTGIAQIVTGSNTNTGNRGYWRYA